METSEFLMDTLGHCVICLDHVTTSGSGFDAETKILLNGVKGQGPPRNDSIILSFRSICKYLATNVKDLLDDSSPISPTPLGQLTTSSELKGTLCCACAPLLERFSDHCLELEENRMKVKHSLQPIFARLAPCMDVDDQNQRLGDFKEEMMRWPKTSAHYGIVERWRRTTFEGCSRILADVSKLAEEDFPIVKIERDIAEDDNSDELALAPLVEGKVNVEQVARQPKGLKSSHFDKIQPNFRAIKVHCRSAHISRVQIPRMTTKRKQANGKSHSSKLRRQQDNNDNISTSLRVIMPDVDSCQFKTEEMSSESDQEDPLEDDVDMRNIFLDNDDDNNQLQTTAQQHGIESQIKDKSPEKPLGLPAANGSRRKCKLQLRKTDEDLEDELGPHPNSGMETQMSSISDANFPCRSCSKTFQWAATLHRHMKNVHPQLLSYPCTFCERTFELKADLKRHNANDHISIESKCKYCSKTLSSLIVAKMHENNFCPKRPRAKLEGHPLSCRRCGITFTSPFFLEQHFLSCSREYGYGCEQCERKFPTRLSLNDHRRRFHVVKK